MKRSSVIAGAAALAVGAPLCRVGAQALTKIRVTTVPIDEGAQIYYAQELGFFAKHGLEADVQSLVNGNDVISAIAGGAIDIGNSNIMSVAGAHIKGIPIQLIAEAGLYNAPVPTAYLLVAAASSIRSGKDLDGKVVGINGLRSITQLSVEAWADQNGGRIATIQFVDMPFPSMDAVLVGGKIAAALLPEPIATFDLKKGDVRILGTPFDAIGKRFAIGGWVATADYISANLATVQKFNDVMTETAMWANDPKNHAQSAAILLKYTKINVGGANRVQYGLHLTTADVQPEIDGAAKYSFLAPAFPAAAMFAPPAARQ